MAKRRMVDTKFWSDSFIANQLNPLDRYLFLYFLTNDKTNILGIYELPIKIIATETGIEKEMLVKMLPRLKGRVYYKDGWVYLKNFLKYQNVTSRDVQTGIENIRKTLPEWVNSWVEGVNKTVIRPSKTVIGQPEVFNLIKPNLTKPNLIEPEEGLELPSERSANFFSMSEAEIDSLVVELKAKQPDSNFPYKAEIKKFITYWTEPHANGYWTEPHANGKKLRWQDQKFFDVRRRLAFWFSRVKKPQDSAKKYQVGSA